MSSPKNHEKAQQHRGRPDKMSIASVLNDDDQDRDQKTEDLTIQFNNVQLTEDDLENRDFAKDRGSETPSVISIDSIMAGRKRRRPRPSCKKYGVEQVYFIWYHRIDLGQDWDDIEREFHHQFGEARKKSGLQCKFYRVLGEKNIEKVRQQGRSGHRGRGNKIDKFGVVERTSQRFPWMRPEDRSKKPTCETHSERKWAFITHT
ncbi:uncharacterized protein Z520_08474 [Fonsecaea multimorphosa CBS 102226]|uniref:Uncharacterized protein n=1 Tax=Fonsecaea multimorphosa CBS 102226 TaxID=1442371 RepID=A0A0D2IF83_9EURO|nr:uncharacterized protein Z520_08474 [Fonsecaea multimorphosa CBS 102226]KIX95766.1 hypothetical protein Z520_08474 [Fonsecaea multimorphosa CBS 102226]OAL21502.1 hypothetical protein AYO22_07898 [Fonsecaea multimorphosa]